MSQGKPSPSKHDDERFWQQMNSRDIALDAPGMSNVIRVANFQYDVFLATAAGKPVLSFSHRTNNSQRRLFQHALSLCATFVGFDAATARRVRTVTSGQGTVFFGRFAEFRVVVATTDRNPPQNFLHTVATVSVTAVFFLLSAAFANAIARNPAFDPGNHTHSIEQVANNTILRTIAFPIAPALDVVPTVPCAFNAQALKNLANLLTIAQRQHKSVSHILAFNAVPPYPHRILCAASPVYNKLTPSDIFMLSSLLPITSVTSTLPQRIYLQTNSYARASVPFARRIELRLDFSDVDAFKAGVGGEHWRPQWSADGADAIWLLVICDVSGRTRNAQDEGTMTLDFLEKRLDRSSLAKDIMIWLERPLRIDDLNLNVHARDVVKAVLQIIDKRVVASVGALEYDHAVEVLSIVRERNVISNHKKKDSDPTSVTLCKLVPSIESWLVVFGNTFVFCNASSQEDVAVAVARDHVLPWLLAQNSNLFPKDTIVSVPPDTPLAFFLAPFES